jgi:hypothetical protein
MLKIYGGHITEELALHKCILFHSCDFFKAMFNPHFHESTQQVVTIAVADGSSVAATLLVLQYIYTTEITIGADNVMEVLAAADKLQLPKLCSTCVNFLENSVSVANACTILNASKQMNLVPLLNSCAKFILRHGKAVLESEGFKELTKEAVVSIISDTDLHATEEEVFGAVMLWGEAEVGRSYDDVDSGLSDAVSDLLPYLRLDEMEQEFLCDRVKQAGVFSTKVLLEATTKIVGYTKSNNKRVFGNKSSSRPAKKHRLG